MQAKPRRHMSVIDTANEFAAHHALRARIYRDLGDHERAIRHQIKAADHAWLSRLYRDLEEPSIHDTTDAIMAEIEPIGWTMVTA